MSRQVSGVKRDVRLRSGGGDVIRDQTDTLEGVEGENGVWEGVGEVGSARSEMVLPPQTSTEALNRENIF